jgi:glutathione S-transferase
MTHTLYDSAISGNAYKVRLLAAQIGLRLRRVEVSVTDGSTRTETFLAKNPNGRVPLLELPDGRLLAESNAILCYLGEGTAFIPTDRFERALMMQWMFFEQYSHEPYVAVARFWRHFLEMTPERLAQIDAKMKGGYAALGVMERHLAGRSFFVGERYSLADIALYAYTHVAGEGDFDLARYPAVGAWLARVAGQPGHIRITD